MIATLPMYDWPELRSDTDAFWQILSKNFQEAGFSCPKVLTHVEDESEGWLERDLFFSQTCGYPFVSKLEGQVELVGTPHFSVDGWEGPNYSSAVIVRTEYEADGLEQCRTARFAFNSNNSLSGYRCMTPLVGRPEDWFADLIKSGGHRRSATMVAEGSADIAAIDAMCWHLYRQFQPDHASRLRVLQWTPPLPGLPYITNLYWSVEELTRLKMALEQGVLEMTASKHNQWLRLCGISHLEAVDYQSIKSL